MYCEHEVNHKDCGRCLEECGLEQLRDIDMLLIFVKGIRDGTTHAVKRYAKANNMHMKDQYHPDGTSIYLQYLDKNYLCRWAITQKLPTYGLA